MMGATFKYVAPLAGTLGYSIEDTAVAIGLMANAGIKGEQAGTSLRATLTRLAKPPKDAQTALDALGVSITNTDGSIKPLNSTLVDLRSKFANLSDEEKVQMASSIAGQEAMSGFLAIIDASDSDFDNLTNAIANSDGTAQSMADTMNNNLNGQITLLKSALESVAIEIGTKVLPPLTSFIQTATEKINTANWDDIINKAIGLAKVILPLIAIWKTYQGVLSIVNAVSQAQTIIQGILKAKTVITTAATTALSVAQGILNVVMSMNPITIIIIAIVALIAAIVLLWNKCDWFRNFFIGLWEGIKNILSTVVNAIVSFFTQTIPNAWNSLIEGAKNLGNAIVQAFKNWWNNLVNMYTVVIPNFIKNIISWFGQLPGKIWEFLSNIITSFWNWGISLNQKVGQAIATVASKIINTVATLPGKMIDTGRNIVEGLWNGIKNMAGWITGKVKEFASGIVNGIKGVLGIHSPSTVMFDMGVNLDKGWINGIESMQMDINDVFKDTFDVSPHLKSETSTHYNSNVNVYVDNKMETDPLGQMVTKTKTFSNGAKNSYNY